MNNAPSDLPIHIITANKKLFDEMTLVFDDIARLLSSGNFQFDEGKIKFLSQKEKFFLLLSTFLGDKNIESYFADTYDIRYLKGLKNSEFTLIFDIYKLLERYFASQHTPLDNDIVVPRIELLQTLEVQNEYSRSYISSLFCHDITFTSETCYEVLQKIDFKQYTDEDLQLKMKTLKDFLTSKKSKDKELIRFVAFLMKSIMNYFEVKGEALRLLKEKEETEIKNTIVKEIFLNNLNFFDEFILWAKEYIGEHLDFKDISSLEDLQNDKEKYSNFLHFRKVFSSKYMEKILIPYQNMFEKHDNIEEENYSTILRGLNHLGDTYDRTISEIAFFTGLKKGFLLGDIYEFLDKQNEIFPELSSHLTGVLLEEFITYTTKPQL